VTPLFHFELGDGSGERRIDPGNVLIRDLVAQPLDSPNTDQGHVLLASASQIQIVSVSPYQLEAQLKNLGKGLLSGCKVVPVPR
jgi:hypothetical protein